MYYLNRDDVDQELRIAISQPGDVLKNASANIFRLWKEYGYYHRDVNAQKQYIEFGLTERQQYLLGQLEYYYMEKCLTAREVCHLFGVAHTHTIQKLFNEVFPKGMGRGGARKNSGRKKQHGITTHP
jgi:hypothetical protein